MERIAVPVGRRPVVRRPKRLLALRSDERLVEDVRAGDDAAFEVVYERHVAGLLGFCRHMLGGQHEAEDAVQQTFVSAHAAMLRGAREIKLKPWLYTIARNRCVSVLRARRETAVEEPEVSTVGLHEQVAERSELRELVADVQKLPEDLRAALVLSEVGDLSHAEVAEVVGVEPVAVKGLVFRARSALIERRDARQADCGEIREELATATGGALRRSRLRYHLEGCPGCQSYLEEVRRQRKLLAVALPVVPTLALQDSVMAATGIGSAGAAAAGALTSGGAAVGGAAGTGAAVSATAPLLGGTLAKVAVVGVLAVGGAGVAAEVVRERDDRHGGSSATKDEAPADVREAAPAGPGGPVGAGPGAARSGERSHGRRGAERRRRGWERADERSGGRSATGEARGQAPGRPDLPGTGIGRGEDSTGKAVGRGEAPPGGRPPDAGAPANDAPKGPPADVGGQGGGGSSGQQPERSPPEQGSAPDDLPPQAHQPPKKQK